MNGLVSDANWRLLKKTRLTESGRARRLAFDPSHDRPFFQRGPLNHFINPTIYQIMSSSRLSTRPTRPSRFATQPSPSSTSSPSLATANASTSISTSTNTRTVNDQVALMAARTASGRATHRVTVRKTAQQVARLQEMWALTTTPTKEQREQIAEEIGLYVFIILNISPHVCGRTVGLQTSLVT